MDLCYNFEKIIDECDQVAVNLLPFTVSRHDVKEASQADHPEMSDAQIKELFRDKYLALLENK